MRNAEKLTAGIDHLYHFTRLGSVGIGYVTYIDPRVTGFPTVGGAMGDLDLSGRQSSL